MREDIEKAVLEEVKEITLQEDVTLASSFETDVMLTSVNAMLLLYKLEKRLSIPQIPQEKFFDCIVVSDLVDLVEEVKNG